MVGLCYRSLLVVIVVGDDEVLVWVFVGRICDTIQDSVRVKDVSSGDILESRAVFLDDFLDLVDLYFDCGEGRGAGDRWW